VRALPGVESAAYSSNPPFRSQGNTQGYIIEGRDPIPGLPYDATLRESSGDYLRTLGVTLLEGRLIDSNDRQGANLAVVINETMAKLHFPGESAIGHRMRFSIDTVTWRTIVGVVRDVRERGYQLAMKPGVYVPYEQDTDTWALPDSLVIRTKTDPASLTSAVRSVIQKVDPEQPIAAVSTMDDILARDVADRRQQMTLLTAFAALALLLASLGLYGLLAYTVSQRSRELGLRMALGASAGQVIRSVVARGLALAAAGLAIGFAGAFALSRTLNRILYGVAANDPGTYAAVALLLTLIVAAACYVPARRASRIDPLTVLREE
jgi:predicted permease